MTINPIQPGGIRPREASETADASKPNVGQPNTKSPILGDQVEISAEARALAAQSDGGDRIPFTESRLTELRALLAAGHYDKPDMMSQLAQRLLDSGDL